MPIFFWKFLKINQIEKKNLKNRWISLDFLCERLVKIMDLKTMGTNLSNKGVKRFGRRINVLPSWLRFGAHCLPQMGQTYPHLSGWVVKALTTVESYIIIPMILVDMFCALTKCINGEMYFKGCSILLQICFLDHLYHHDCVLRFT